MKTVEIFSTIEINFHFISVEIFKIETFQSRLGCVEIFISVETNRDIRDFRDKSRFFEIFVGNRDFVEINRDFVEINRDFLVSIEIFWILDICGRWWVKVLP